MGENRKKWLFSEISLFNLTKIPGPTVVPDPTFIRFGYFFQTLRLFATLRLLETKEYQKLWKISLHFKQRQFYNLIRLSTGTFIF